MHNPVSATAFFCAGVRMLDAQRPDSLLNDHYAELFMGEDGIAVFNEFRRLSDPIATNQVRCHLIDEIVREKLKADPNLRVILVGAGFDSRAFRLQGGRWVELDEAPILMRKELFAPAASCPNPLERSPIDFAREKLIDRLAAWRTDEQVLVICEGVLMYLETSQVVALAQALKTNFPRHWLCCDLMSKSFSRYCAGGVRRAVAKIGARFRDLQSHPLRSMKSLRYQPEHVVSVVEMAAAAGRLRFSGVLERALWALPVVRDGYRVALLRSV